MDFIETQAAQYSELSGQYMSLGKLFQRKLWHQLTGELEAFLSDPASSRGDNFVQLAENFIAKFEGKLNQLSFVQLSLKVSKQYCPSQPPTAAELENAAAYLRRILEKRARLGEEAFVVCKMGVAELLIAQGTADSLDGAKALVEEAEPLLQALEGSGSETAVNASFHRVKAEYHKVRGPPAAFYTSSLQFLAYTPLESLSPEAQRSLAVDMSLAALVGEGVYNFGEVLAQPILGALSGTPLAWLHQMLLAFSAGDIDRFAELYAANKQQFDAQPALAANMSFLREKLALLSLVALVFHRPPESRNVSFADVSAATKMPIDQVELLLMRAMSRKLVKGTIDEVSQTVHISWLKPRVLDPNQLKALGAKLSKWSDTVHATSMFVESETPLLFV